MSIFQLDDAKLSSKAATAGSPPVEVRINRPISTLTSEENDKHQNRHSRDRRFAPRYMLDIWHRLVDAALVIGLCVVSGAEKPALTALLIIIGLELVPNLYRHQLTLSVLDSAPRAVLAGTAVTFGAVILTNSEWSIGVVVKACIAVSCALIFSRLLVTPLLRLRRRKSANYRHRTLIVGAGTASVDLATTLIDEPEYGLEPVAFADRRSRTEAAELGLPIADINGSIVDLIRQFEAKTVIIGFSDYDDREVLEFLRACVREDAEVFIVPRLFDYVGIQGSMDRVKTIPLIRMRRAAHRSFTWKFKRPFDAACSGLALLALSPVLALLALLVKLDDPKSPILFRQVRIGQDGHEFELLKFRSMRPAKTDETNTNWNGAADPRMTRLGSVMRKYSLDELPQIYNVLRGDMAVVGPRPERPHFVSKFSKVYHGYHSRHRVPVGLTGFAAINGLRGDTSIKDRAMFDNFYIENWSLWLDVKIVLSTFKAVFTGSGA